MSDGNSPARANPAQIDAASEQAREHEIETLRARLRELTASRVNEVTLASYTLALAPTGARVTLRELFAGKPDLLLIHNMGARCSYCTLWADGINGVAHHLMDRCGVALLTPDDCAAAGAFAAERGWRFPVVSMAGTTIARDMGFASADGREQPGVSACRLDGNGRVVRVSSATFGPGDEYCAVWPLLALLRDGANGWEPKFHYA